MLETFSRWFGDAWGGKIALTIAAFAVLVAFRYVVEALARLVSGREQKHTRGVFWARQIASIVALLGVIAVVVAVWIRPTRGTGLPVGIATAGLAVALQKVWTAFAGYLVIMRGRVYTVGDRVAIGDVRGDVLSVGFIYTRIMEMGQDAPSKEKQDVWVPARQFTGRIVTVTNDRVFDDPIFNYTRDFPFIYEEIVIPIKYDADRKRAEKILLDAVEPTTKDIRALSDRDRHRLEHKYFLKIQDLTPRVYYRLTDNWLELTVRFVVPEHGIRSTKDEISRRILDALDEAKIQIASATFEVVGIPPVRVEGAQNGGRRASPDVGPISRPAHS